MTQRDQTRRPGDPDRPPSSGLGDLALMLWRERGFMLLVFLISFLVLAGAAIVTLDRMYTARTSLLVRLDEAYAFNPVIGQASGGGQFGMDQIIQSEVNILRADTLKRRTIETLGLRAVYPELANAFVEAPQGEARDRVLAQAIRRVGDNLTISAAAASANIEVTFKHERPDVAANFLNAFIREYLRYRPDVLLSFNPESYRERREEYEARLSGANSALEQFLTQNGIGDFVSYRTSLQSRQTEVDSALFAARADLEQARAQLGALRSRIETTPAEIEQYVESNASGQLADLMIQRVDLLARYTEDSIPVRELEARIAELSQFITSGGAENTGTTRTGPNPVRQQLQTDESQLTGQAAALGQRVAELTRQKQELQQEQIRVQGLTPQYERLARDISSLQETVNAIASSQEGNRAQRALATDSLDNVSIVQPAVTPTQGSSLKKPAVAGAFIVSGFIAMLAGLIRGLLRGGPAIDWRDVMGIPERAPREPRPARQARAARTAPAESAIDESLLAETADPYATPRLPVLAVIERRSDPAPAYA